MPNQDLISENSILSALELPIDSRTAKKLDGGKKWLSIISLDENEHRRYQDLALAASKKCGIARIHLDIEYWTPI